MDLFLSSEIEMKYVHTYNYVHSVFTFSGQCIVCENCVDFFVLICFPLFPSCLVDHKKTFIFVLLFLYRDVADHY